MDHQLIVSRRDVWLILAGLVALGALFWLDLSLERGIVDGYPYLSVMFLALVCRARWLTWCFAAAGALLTVLGVALSEPSLPNSGADAIANINAAVSIVLLAVTAWLIDRRKLTESALAEKVAALTRLTQQKNQLLSIVAHDLRAPFNPLIGYCDLLAADSRNLSATTIAQYATAIRNSAHRILETLDRLLEWSVALRSGAAPVTAGCDLADLVSENIALLAPLAERKRVALHSRLTSLSTASDTIALTTVLRNLIANAIKYTSEGGNVLVSGERRADHIRVIIQDTGAGMTRETLDAIGGASHPPSSPGTAGELGTGLGLQLCQDLVRRAGGTLDFESSVGIGTTVTLRLPVPG